MRRVQVLDPFERPLRFHPAQPRLRAWPPAPAPPPPQERDPRPRGDQGPGHHHQGAENGSTSARALRSAAPSRLGGRWRPSPRYRFECDRLTVPPSVTRTFGESDREASHVPRRERYVADCSTPCVGRCDDMNRVERLDAAESGASGNRTGAGSTGCARRRETDRRPSPTPAARRRRARRASFAARPAPPEQRQEPAPRSSAASRPRRSRAKESSSASMYRRLVRIGISSIASRRSSFRRPSRARRGRLRERGAHPRVAGVDVDRLAGLRIDETRQPDVGRHLLSLGSSTVAATTSCRCARSLSGRSRSRS